jgi:hypothetical protein
MRGQPLERERGRAVHYHEPTVLTIDAACLTLIPDPGRRDVQPVARENR